VHLCQFLIFSRFIGMLQKGANHPDVSQLLVDCLHQVAGVDRLRQIHEVTP
jgi:hypothetical protein